MTKVAVKKKKKPVSLRMNQKEIILILEGKARDADKRTEVAQKELASYKEHLNTLVEKQINPPVVIAPDSVQYNTGYRDGYNRAQSENDIKNNWWKFWK